MNILFASMIAFFWPCYMIYTFCNEETCDGFLSDAGRLVQYMWYPGTVELNYGARGPARYNGGDEKSGVLRGACVPCPSQLLAAVDQGYRSGIGPLEAKNPYTQALDVSRAQCVRVGDVGLAPGREYLLRGPRAMSAKDYVLYQLFGPKFRETFQAFYGPKVYEGTGSRNLVMYNSRNLKDLAGLYNKQLFTAGTPFPYYRGVLDTSGTRENNEFLVSGYYLINGRPFIPPKLWDYINVFIASAGKNSNIPTSAADLWTTVPKNYGGQYHPSQAMAKQIIEIGMEKSSWKDYFAPTFTTDNLYELEWWYPDLCGNKSKCGDNWFLKTSLQYWTEEHYEDYAQRFFAGGGDVTALWSGAMQTLLPNVTVNTNAVAQRRRK